MQGDWEFALTDAKSSLTVVVKQTSLEHEMMLRLKRPTIGILAAVIASAAAANDATAAAIDALDVITPVVASDQEVIDAYSVIGAVVPPGLAGAGVITHGVNISKALLVGLDETGSRVGGATLNVSSGITSGFYSDTQGGSVGISLENVIGIEAFLQTSGVSSFRLIVTTSDVVLNASNLNGIQTKYSVDEAIDECFYNNGPAAAVSVDPPSIAVDTGAESIVLEARATGALPISFLWQRNGVSLIGQQGYSGAASSTLTIHGRQPSHSDIYSVMVVNSYGMDVSDDVFVVVRSNTCDGDSNGDGVVNFSDISEVIAKWLNSCP